MEPLENFETWLLIWTAANLGSFREGDDLRTWVRLRGDELTEDATMLLALSGIPNCTVQRPLSGLKATLLGEYRT